MDEAQLHYQKANASLKVCADTASRHIHRAVELGLPKAMFRLGLAHCERPWDYNLGPLRSRRYGRLLIQKAADLGDKRAECLLAVSYLKGSCAVRQHWSKGKAELERIRKHNPLAEIAYQQLIVLEKREAEKEAERER
jgi:TPR repeat protein